MMKVKRCAVRQKLLEQWVTAADEFATYVGHHELWEAALEICADSRVSYHIHLVEHGCCPVGDAVSDLNEAMRGRLIQR